MNSESQINLTVEDLNLLQSVLNEVLNGFSLPELDRRIGMERSEAEQFLAQLLASNRRNLTTLNLHQLRTFRNALFETIREVGEEEFHSRTGHTFQQGNDVLKKLDQRLQTVRSRSS